MYIDIERKPISRDARYRVPGVPGEPGPNNTGEGKNVPDPLFPVMLKSEGAELRIGVVGKMENGKWGWYSLFGSQETYRAQPTPEGAVMQLIEWASGLKEGPPSEPLRKGVPVRSLI